ncbi:MAG: TauD/TfdA family dioxygenase [Pseudomonadota bacterium]
MSGAWQTQPLTPAFGVEVTGVDLNAVAAGAGFDQLRALFEAHSVLLFRGQDFGDDAHLALAARFGEIEDRLKDERKPGEAYKVPEVSNLRADGAVSDEMDLQTLNLKANMLWHADSTFLPRPALTNILIGRIITSTGGATELASTRAGWAAMPAALKQRIEGRGVWHRYSHSRAQISPELAKLPMFNKWPEQHWKAVWTNPVTGQEALYVASHAYLIDGYSETESAALIKELIGFCTQPEFTYAHAWEVGDVLIWDQRAVLHRATPWPYHEPRKLSSICVTVEDSDGLDQMRVA